jgi:hypothetical protein
MIVSKAVVSVAVLIVLVAGPAFAAVNIETVRVGDRAARPILYSGIDPRIELMSISKNAGRALSGIYATEHVQVLYRNVPEEYARAAAAIYEVCDASLRKRFGVRTGICTIPGQKLHLHFLAQKGYQLNLWTDPTSVYFPLVVNTMPNWERGLSPPERGGPHIVYGLCHELGHVLMGWEDCRHQWADYLGSLLVEDVASELGVEAWPQPYEIRAEGMKRFLKKIEGVRPDRSTDSGTARMFYDVGESFGLEVWGKALDWIKKHRQGRPFYATRLYRLDDLGDALLALGRDPKEVRRIFGGSKRSRQGPSLFWSSIQSPYYTRGVGEFQNSAQ